MREHAPLQKKDRNYFRRSTSSRDEMAATDYILRLSTVQGTAFKSLIESLRDIVFDIAIHFDSTGIRISTMDGARCSIIHSKLPAENFEEYSCPAPFESGVNLQNLYRLLRPLSVGDSLTMSVAKTDPSTLNILISNAEKRSNTAFRYKLLDVDADAVQLPSATFERIFTMPSAQLQRLMRDMSALSGNITISSRGDSLTFSCSGDFADQETMLSTSDGSLCMATDGKDAPEVSNTYLIKYIQLFSRATSLSNVVTIFLKQGFPLILEYSGGLGNLRFLLAPVVN